MATTRPVASSRISIPAGTVKSLAFDGAASYATVPVTPSTSGFCMGVWVRAKKISATQVIADWQTAFDTNGFHFRVDVARSIICVLCNGASPDAIINRGANTLTQNEWWFCVVTYLPNSGKVYINGTLAGTDTSISMTAATGQSVTLGRNSYASSMFLQGNLKNFTFQNTTTPWTVDQINALMYDNVIPAGAQQWAFNGNANDQTGANAATLSGTSYVDDAPARTRSAAGVTRTATSAAISTALLCGGNMTGINANPIDLSKMQIGLTSDWSGVWKATLWMKNISPNNDDHCLGNYDLNFGGLLGYSFYASSNTGALKAVIGNTFYTSSSGLFTYGVPHYFGFTLTGTTLKGYVDGALVWTVTVVRKATGSTNRHLLSEGGAAGFASRTVWGLCYEIMSSLTLFSSTDMANIAAGGQPPAADFHYLCNERGGSALTDYSGNANHAMVVVPQWRTTGRQTA